MEQLVDIRGPEDPPEALAGTEDGRTIELQAVIEDDGPYVETTNVVLAENLEPIVAVIVDQIDAQAGVELDRRCSPLRQRILDRGFGESDGL